MSLNVLRKVSVISSTVILSKSFILLVVTVVINDIEIIDLRNPLNIMVYILLLVVVGGIWSDFYTRNLLHLWLSIAGISNQLKQVYRAYGCPWLRITTFWMWWRDIILLWNISNALAKKQMKDALIVKLLIISQIISDIVLAFSVIII